MNDRPPIRHGSNLNGQTPARSQHAYNMNDYASETVERLPVWHVPTISVRRAICQATTNRLKE